jgi:hypothetical protein
VRIFIPSSGSARRPVVAWLPLLLTAVVWGVVVVEATVTVVVEMTVTGLLQAPASSCTVTRKMASKTALFITSVYDSNNSLSKSAQPQAERC